jgi:hypothetical protein
MSNSNPTPENPYAAPQTPTRAKFVSAVDPSGMQPGELPCHRCGGAVPPMAMTCPHCGKRPLYDGMELVITAVLATGTAGLVQGWLQLRKIELTGLAQFLPLALAIGVIWPPVRYLFAKLKRGRW